MYVSQDIRHDILLSCHQRPETGKIYLASGCGVGEKDVERR